MIVSSRLRCNMAGRVTWVQTPMAGCEVGSRARASVQLALSFCETGPGAGIRPDATPARSHPIVRYGSKEGSGWMDGGTSLATASRGNDRMKFL